MLSSRKRPVKLSRGEIALLNVLPADGRKLSTHEIVAAFYGADVPLNGRQILVDRLASIARKLELIGDKRRLSKTGRCGPRAIQYWLSEAPQQ